MFEGLKNFPCVVVSGPHRSGTTICGQMIAADTGHRAVREEAFGCSDETNFREWLARDGVVLQAPFMAHRLHYLHEIVDPETVVVVFMRRDVAEIQASQDRLDRYLDDTHKDRGGGVAFYRLRQYHASSPDPSIVYENWDKQKIRLMHWREVEYASLAAHSLWLNDRTQFHFRQTR